MILTRRKLVVLGVAGLIVAVVLVVGLGLYFGLKGSDLDVTPYTGAVVSNGYECAAIGSSILQKDGSVVDAAVAALFCEGVAMPQSMGLGGGFLMTIYIRENKSVHSLNARESAPIQATEDMFKGNASLSAKGGLAVAVPGELLGYWEAHQKYGKLPWAEIVEPTIQLCKKGHLVTPYLAQLFKKQEQSFLNTPSLREIFIDPKTNKAYEEGDYVKRPQLAKMLEIVARDGAKALYDGVLTQSFVDDIQSFGGIITVDDMNSYEIEWQEPINASLPFNQTLYTSPLPGSGVILTFILNILNGFLDYSNINSITNWQRIVESFKFGYGKRTELGDAGYVNGIEKLLANLTSAEYAAMIRKSITDDSTFQDPAHYGANVTQVEDHGTAHLSVLGSNGDAVSVTSTINLYFGASIRSVSTGIILNDEMDDFSSPDIINDFGLPPSPANYIVPHKRPLSSMCPSIIVDEHGDVVLVIGAAGGSKITTSVALITMKNLWFKESLATAVPAARLHHQLFPMHINFEHNFNTDLVTGLAKIGHQTSIAAATDAFAALTAISKSNGVIEAMADDVRRGGQVSLVR